MDDKVATGKAIVIGDVRIFPFVSTRYRLDGGSMFGVVPKPLWEKKAPPDSRNRILLNVNSLIVETGASRMLVEPGMGSKYSAKQREIYDLADFDVETALAGLGIAPEDIDVVIPTHLHFDHAGGLTKGEPGDWRPVFPNARVIVQKSEWNAAVDPRPIERGSYFASDLVPIAEDGRLELIEGETQVAPGVSLELTGGHTRGHQMVRISSGGSEVLYPGDLIPTLAHLKLRWMAWDLNPEQVYEKKTRLLEECASSGALVIWTHDPHVSACRVSVSGGGTFEVEEGSVVEADVTPLGAHDPSA